MRSPAIIHPIAPSERQLVALIRLDEHGLDSNRKRRFKASRIMECTSEL